MRCTPAMPLQVHPLGALDSRDGACQQSRPCCWGMWAVDHVWAFVLYSYERCCRTLHKGAEISPLRCPTCWLQRRGRRHIREALHSRHLQQQTHIATDMRKTTWASDVVTAVTSQQRASANRGP